MAGDNWEEEQRYQPGPAQPAQGMSTGLKVVIGLLIAGGVVFLGCMGFVFYLGYQFTQRFEVSDNPVDVRATTKSIVDIEIPEESFPPQASMKMDMFVLKMKMAIYGEQGGNTVLLIAEGIGSGEFEDDLERGMEEGMRESLEEQGSSTELDVTQTEERTFTIKGEEVEFSFTEGTLLETGEEVHQITGGFAGKEGRASIILQVEKEKYNEEEIMKMLESIK